MEGHDREQIALRQAVVGAFGYIHGLPKARTSSPAAMVLAGCTWGVLGSKHWPRYKSRATPDRKVPAVVTYTWCTVERQGPQNTHFVSLCPPVSLTVCVSFSE